MKKKIIVLYLFVFTMLASAMLIFYNGNQRLLVSSHLVTHTQEVLHLSDNVLLDVLNLESGMRGYLLTRNKLFLEYYYNSSVTIGSNLQALAALTVDNHEQQARIEILKNSANERLSYSNKIIELIDRDVLKKEDVTNILYSGQMLSDKLRGILANINSEETKLLNQRKIDVEQSSTKGTLLYFLPLAFIVVVVTIIFISLVYQQSESKRAGEQKQSSQYARSLIEASLDPLVTINSTGQIMDVNEASIRVTGRQRENLIGTDFSNYFTEPEKARTGYRQVFEKGFVADYSLTIKDRNGKLTDVLYNASVYKDEKGKVLGVFAAARDVTQQKLLSKYSLSLIEASHDPLVTISAAGKITDMNEATVRITGRSREKLRGTDFIDYFTETQKAREVYQEVFARGFVIDSPLTLRHKDGKLTDVLFNGSVYRDEMDNVLGVVVVARDITEQKKFKDELIEAKSRAEQATIKAEESNKLKEAFLANMSHEIRTPMNAIIGFSTLLAKRPLGPQEKDFVVTIKDAGENLLTIINDILDISKIEAGMMTFERHTFSVRQIFTSLHVMFLGKAMEKNLELVFSCHEDVPDLLIGDNTRLTQIIINLAGNAIKFTQKGKVEVTVKVVSTDNDVVLLGFSIQDTGIGIPQNKLNTIFERFIQAESHTTREYGGTGLGLSIGKQLVELQGGALTVKSIVGMGSVFSFTIPYTKSEEIVLPKREPDTRFSMESLSNLKVLLVEDNKLNVKLILNLFSEYNLNVEVAWNGSEGIAKLKAGNFDIILMDMEMPVLNGYAAATFIRKELKDAIPIIAMTAHAMAGEREKCLGLGMDEYISKPINANVLFEKINNLTINRTRVSERESPRLNEKVCNIRYITEIMGGKKHLIKGIMDEFLKQLPEELNAISDAVQKQEFAKICALAHSMKSSVSVMDISALTPILRELEDLGGRSVDIEKIVILTNELSEICNKAITEIEVEKYNFV